MPVPYAVKTLGEIQGFMRNRGLKGLVCKTLGRLNWHLTRCFVQGAVAVDACTEKLLGQHYRSLRIPRGRLLKVENAANVQRFAPRDPKQSRAALQLEHLDPVLGYVGGFPVERGGLEMLEVAARLRRGYPRLGVVIVGEPGAERLRERARALGLEDCAVIPGRVSYDEIPTYVDSFDVCFAVDRPERFRRAGNSYQKIRQYLACGKPVVTCAEEDSFLLREGLAESVDVDDLSSVEAATRKLLARDEGRRRRHAARAVGYAREYLSTAAALNQRVDFWNRRLAEVGLTAAGRRDDAPTPHGPAARELVVR
jgi:glycosyltransferase involved in cell wall biosynthesis